jgi:hypothetical protein
MTQRRNTADEKMLARTGLLVDFNSTWSYTYRSDGPRTKKYKNGSNYSNFRYDGLV